MSVVETFMSNDTDLQCLHLKHSCIKLLIYDICSWNQDRKVNIPCLLMSFLRNLFSITENVGLYQVQQQVITLYSIRDICDLSLPLIPASGTKIVNRNVTIECIKHQLDMMKHIVMEILIDMCLLLSTYLFIR